MDHDFIQYLVNCKFVKLIIIVPNDRFHHEKGTYEIENKKEEQKELSNKQEPIKVRDTLIMAILPIFFGLMGFATIDAAQPLTGYSVGFMYFFGDFSPYIPTLFKLERNSL